ncbi:hypothetical protein, conserved [Eimeria praecox]|uniref:MORN repeat-containing protein n=1 Tax=Eimeria praecox TaxID=51316 RepID=U6GLK8_9EIME|nr:hypothetical protein, conserved [Eimeria praecox]
MLSACPSGDLLASPETVAATPEPLTAATQKESFEAVGRAAGDLLAAAYCTQDPEVIRRLAEELNVIGDPWLVSSEPAEGAPEGRKGENTDSSASTSHLEGEEDSVVSSQYQEPANIGTFSLQEVPLGSVLFSGNLTITTVCFENGTKYTGLLCSRMRLCGDASIQWPSGATYRGQVTRGLRHGIGTFTSADGKFTYEGEWYEGVRSGWGVLTSADGSKYSGEWVEGRRHGFGEQVYADGSRYEGQWVDGLQDGQGLMIWKEPSVQYVGEWKRGSVSGWGRQTWIETPDVDGGGSWTVGRNLQQNQYEGQFQNGRREGVGAFSYSNGARYEGSWVADQKHGFGTFKSETGAIYEGLFVYDRMAEAPPSILDDPVRALVDLSTAQQVEVYRHLEAYNGPNLWTQAPACERLAARTIRSVYQTMLRNVCILRRVYGTYRRLAPMPHSDPYVLSCAQFWCLAFDADLLSTSSSLYETAKVFQVYGPLNSLLSLPNIDAALAAAPSTAPPAAPYEATGEAPVASADAASTAAGEQKQDSAKPLTRRATSPPEKARTPAYEAIAEDSLRLQRRPVLFTAFLRALVLLLQSRLRSLRKGERNHSVLSSGSTPVGGAVERVDTDDPSCLSLAWIALCRKLRILGDTLERQIQNEVSEVSHKAQDRTDECGSQTLQKSTSQAEASDAGTSGLRSMPSEQSQGKQSVPPQPPQPLTRRQDSPPQQLKRIPSGQGRPKPSISRQQSGATPTSTRKAPDAPQRAPATESSANDSRAKDPSQWRHGSHGESCTLIRETEEIAACAGRHAEVFRQAVFAEKCCILDEALHRALFSSSPHQAGSSIREHGNSTEIPGAVTAGLVLPSEHQQGEKGAGEVFVSLVYSSSWGSSCGLAADEHRQWDGTTEQKKQRWRINFAAETICKSGEAVKKQAASLLKTTPLSAFALPALSLVAVIMEVLPESGGLNRHPHDSKKPSQQQEGRKEQGSLQEDVEVVEFSTAALGDATAAKRDEIQRQQQQQLLLLEQQQQALREAMRRGQLSWTQIVRWKLTFIEVQRLFLRIVQLKMPPAIAALLTVEHQLEEFLQLLSATVSPPLRDRQKLLIPLLRQVDTHEQQQICQQYSLSGDDSPAARSDATLSAAPTADGERPRCFWQGFCDTIGGSQICELPLLIDEPVTPEAPNLKGGTESETSNSLD